MDKRWGKYLGLLCGACLYLAVFAAFAEQPAISAQTEESAAELPQARMPDPGSIKLQNMLSWLSSQTKIEIMERGQKKAFQLALDEFAVETTKELTAQEAESLVQALLPGGKLLGQEVCYLLVAPPMELNGSLVTEMIRAPRVSSLDDLKKIKSLCPVLYPADETDKQGKAVVAQRSGKNRRIVTSQVVVKLVSDVAKAGIGSILQNYAGMDLGQNPLSDDLKNLDFGSGFQALSATLDMQRDSGMVVHPQIAVQQQKKATPNDPNFPSQWHINDSSSGDINVQTAWDTVTGSSIRIAIVDDGLELGHEDLDANTPAVNGDLTTSKHWDFNGNDNNPAPGTDDFHGTACAGLAGAVWNNNLGVAGVAPGSELLGLRLIAAPSTDAQEAAALGWDRAQVSSNSWGPPDDELQLAGPGPLTEAALRNAVTNGRNGRGTVFVWAGGNGDLFGDYSNFDGYASSPYVIAVAATSLSGAKTTYSERGANLLISSPGGDDPDLIRTTDISGATGYDASNYTGSFNGTSAATPIVAGVVALMLETNPNLGWRDVKEILITTAFKNDAGDSDWSTNDAGFDFNHQYGAGLIDAKAAVDMAAGWTNLQEMSEYSQTKSDLGLAIPDTDPTGVSVAFDAVPDAENMRVETVLVQVDITHTYRGDLTCELISPSGMRSQLAETSGDPSNNLTWTFSTVRHWGEDSAGVWSVKVADEVGADLGSVNGITITFLGVNAPILGPPTFSLARKVHSVSETSGTVDIKVVRTGSLDSAVNVDYTTADLEATAGADYTAAAGTLNFAVGESSKTVSIPILNEDDQEPSERFSFTLSNPVAVVPDPENVPQLGADTQSIVTIKANDSTLVRFESVNYSMFEGQIVANVVVERFRDLDKWSFVNFYSEDGTARKGEDFDVKGKKVLFLPGQSRALLPLQLTSDGVIEGLETFRLHLGDPSGGLDQAVSGGTTDIDLND